MSPSLDSENIVQIRGLSRKFAGFYALNNVSFDVRKGEILGFLGPNGAGKTTTMRIITGYLAPTRGSVVVAGMDVVMEAIETKKKIGYLPENVAIYPEMRVIEYLKFRARLKGMGGRSMRKRVDEVISLCGLEDFPRKIVGTLSKGMRQRVGLAESLVHDPEILILDEPTIGLDPNQIRQVRALIKSLAPAKTIVLSSHILSEVENLCDRVLIINKGRIAASDSPDNLLGLLKGNVRIIAEIYGPRDAIKGEMESIPGVTRVFCRDKEGWGEYICECEKGRDIRKEIFQAVVVKNWQLRELRFERFNLEDIFVSLTAPDAVPLQDDNGK